jgi:hypothetical protein
MSPSASSCLNGPPIEPGETCAAAGTKPNIPDTADPAVPWRQQCPKGRLPPFQRIENRFAAPTRNTLALRVRACARVEPRKSSLPPARRGRRDGCDSNEPTNVSQGEGASLTRGAFFAQEGPADAPCGPLSTRRRQRQRRNARLRHRPAGTTTRVASGASSLGCQQSFGLPAIDSGAGRHPTALHSL